ncbi:MAG TPA: hypothetical protein VJ983_02175 [candidate division Zixibacteria bacterium]|nr:hypothetical protein [candidate division Zixibacteria bacterium]
MKSIRSIVLLLSGVLICFSSAWATSVAIKISGPGAVNDSTIKAGQNVNFDVYLMNDGEWRGFSLGFKFSSPDMKDVIHVSDSGKGLTERGDVKAYNGWQDKSVWDLGGVYVVETDWNGKLPEIMGFGGVTVKKRYKPHPIEKKLSMTMKFPEPGTIYVDSSYFPPTGKWLFAIPNTRPKWGGPYKFTVVK